MKTETSTLDTTTQKATVYAGNVVLITGGRSEKDVNATMHSAEIFLPNSPNKPCILPELPAPYLRHTQDRGMLCGGLHTRYSCHQWNSKEAKFPEKPVHEFKPGRHRLVSWTPVAGQETFLIGGGSQGPRETSTIVKQGVFIGYGGFDLKYPLFGACSITDPETDTVVITGGNLNSPNFKITSLYNQDGFVEDFGKLTYQRYQHGCTSYVADKKRVKKLTFSKYSLCYFIDLSGNRRLLFSHHRDS